MRRYSIVGILVAIAFVALFVFFLKKTGSREMAREKKKFTLVQLEEHVTFWIISEIEKLRDAVDVITYDDSIGEVEKDLMLSGVANQFIDLLELLYPIKHDEDSLVEWTHSFIQKYKLPDTDEH